MHIHIEPSVPIIIGFSPDPNKLDFNIGEEVNLFCQINATVVPTADILWTDSKVFEYRINKPSFLDLQMVNPTQLIIGIGNY